ncbi:MAG: N-acetyltransferase family protein [Bacteroidota bacterium]
MKSPYSIRNATREDCPAMLELIRELALYEKAPQEVTVDPLHFEASGFGPNPVWWAFVVESSDGIVAFALYYIRYSTWKGQVMYLEDILVTESHRRNGIGSILMDRLIEEAKERSFGRIVWQVLEWNEPAIHFYRKYGASFDPEWVNVILDI